MAIVDGHGMPLRVDVLEGEGTPELGCSVEGHKLVGFEHLKTTISLQGALDIIVFRVVGACFIRNQTLRLFAVRCSRMKVDLARRRQHPCPVLGSS